MASKKELSYGSDTFSLKPGKKMKGGKKGKGKGKGKGKLFGEDR